MRFITSSWAMHAMDIELTCKELIGANRHWQTRQRNHSNPETRRNNLAKQNAPTPEQETTELVRNLLILQLGLSKVPQDKIRKIAGCGINRVSDVLKHIPKSER
jgi:hypothetical protein